MQYLGLFFTFTFPEYSSESCWLRASFSTFVWKHGAPSDWEELKTVKGEIIEECEVPNWLEKLGLKIK